MRFFVTGASGFIGSAVVSELLAAGYAVTGLARSGAAAERVAALGATPAEGSLADLDVLRAAATASDGVVHLAYGHGDPDAAEADRRVIDALGHALAGSGRPLVVTSGTLVLAPGRLGRESDPAVPGAPAASRGPSETAAVAWAGRGVRASVVRLAPCVHDGVRRGFAGALMDLAQRTGIAGYLGDGAARWPALHRRDAAVLYRLALEQAPTGTIVHGVGEEGVSLRALAARIAALLDVPSGPIPADQAEAHFGWLAALVGTDAPASSEATRQRFGWNPSGPGLLEDLVHFVGTAAR
jgi:nucleoside-diphosphate-sugar epimerase